MNIHYIYMYDVVWWKFLYIKILKNKNMLFRIQDRRISSLFINRSA